MDNNFNSNPLDEDHQNEYASNYDGSNIHSVEGDNNGRAFAWSILGIATAGCIVLCAAAFFFFQPDGQSLVDKYFPSPKPPINLTATQQVLNATNTAQAFQSKATSVASELKVVLKDNFDSNKNRWDTGTSSDDRSKSIITMADGKYNWDISTYDFDINWEISNAKPVGDFITSVEAKQISGPETAEYGLLFRLNSDYYSYYFGINNKGEYFLDLYYDNWSTLIGRTKSKLIHPNEANRLTVLAEGSHFIFFINDQFVAEYTDDRIKNGRMGLFSILDQSEQQAVFEFDNFELRAP